MIGAILAKRAARSGFGALERRDVKTFLASWKEDATFIYPGDLSVSGQIAGKQAIEMWFRGFLEQFPQFHFTLKNVCVDNIFDLIGTNIVAVVWDINLTNQEGITVLMVDTNYRHVAAATMAGLPSQCASIVSEYMEEIDLAGIGRLLAVTPNDDLNTLAAMEFAPVFGRENVYQLSPGESMLKKRESASPNRPGRVLFSQQANYLRLASRAAEGAQVKKTRITDEFTFDDFQRRYGETALVLFVLTEAKTLQISTAESPLIPKRGQTVIAFVEENEDRPVETNAAASS